MCSACEDDMVTDYHFPHLLFCMITYHDYLDILQVALLYNKCILL